ncbi:WXG100 family type VII secretion target [Actinoalloteichus hymeniacidonis]|uniref:Uncharacterized protein n=1 Tax=Actinoalloteichus hymeniacidonis TaxID=340345 RepID=A0AAC9MVZ1_9PSEU|nr:hypothetical protein [Actinoalloteichus hymeniacidonis]AOS61633.1 hypothetical protein TL08_04015 [Actinoalloteichus hymeniacidonis]MBB5910355.1 hypothetical protein [Actinoalloteichus hymeniacidonis]
MSEGFDVDPEALRGTGDGLITLADDIHASVGELSGESSALGGLNQGFESSTLLIDAESQWQEAVETLSARTSAGGGLLKENADEYLRMDEEARGSFVLE